MKRTIIVCTVALVLVLGAAAGMVGLAASAPAGNGATLTINVLPMTDDSGQPISNILLARITVAEEAEEPEEPVKPRPPGGGGPAPAPVKEPEEPEEEPEEPSEDEPEDEPEAVPPKTVIKLTVGSIKATVDGRPYTLDAAPFIKPEVNRTLVPVRFVAETLGARVDWRAESRQVVITDGDTEIILTIGSQVALVNGQQVLVDCAAELHPPGRTFVPLRFVAEFLGARVHWGGPTQRVIIKR